MTVCEINKKSHHVFLMLLQSADRNRWRGHRLAECWEIFGAMWKGQSKGKKWGWGRMNQAKVGAGLKWGGAEREGGRRRKSNARSSLQIGLTHAAWTQSDEQRRRRKPCWLVSLFLCSSALYLQPEKKTLPSVPILRTRRSGSEHRVGIESTRSAARMPEYKSQLFHLVTGCFSSLICKMGITTVSST